MVVGTFATALPVMIDCTKLSFSIAIIEKERNKSMEKIKINEQVFDIKNINKSGNLLIIEFAAETNLSNLDLSELDLYTNGDLKCTEFAGYTTIYKTDGNTATLSNDGSVYTELAPYVPTEPTVDELAMAQISALKSQITETDYKIIKCSEYQLVGLSAPYDITQLHTDRQALRDQINTLEVSLTTT